MTPSRPGLVGTIVVLLLIAGDFFGKMALPHQEPLEKADKKRRQELNEIC